MTPLKGHIHLLFEILEQIDLIFAPLNVTNYDFSSWCSDQDTWFTDTGMLNFILELFFAGQLELLKHRFSMLTNSQIIIIMLALI